MSAWLSISYLPYYGSLLVALNFSDRPPKESPAPVISLMGVALYESYVIIEALDSYILDSLVRSSDIVVSSYACSRFLS